MSDTLLQDKLSIVQKTLDAWIETHDVQYVTDDAVFTFPASGQESRGKEAIREMIQYFYHTAFDAKAEKINTIVTETKALGEGYFVGKHIGDFNGIPATNRDVRVPFCVSFEFRDGLISKARVYLLGDVLMQQLGLLQNN